MVYCEVNDASSAFAEDLTFGTFVMAVEARSGLMHERDEGGLTQPPPAPPSPPPSPPSSLMPKGLEIMSGARFEISLTLVSKNVY